ncbi:MAG: transcriptional regulator [Hydrogenophilales bacterium CG_4_9_14_3_um_filter_63_34]|nr:MAG: transcriptional regulator [Hydrogenophilales bacterium CG_4_10_14_3_um_filter_63_21]PJB04637.1 MAG: transcriptional regulator [Hydrogenophilales bacterium CG_4_9_14_3_um_filter_63_34]
MPEISRFLGILILMHFREHNPPHFHVRYNDFEAAILIESLGIMEGKLPPRVLSLAVEWAGLHQAELLDDWNTLRTTGQYRRIDPLV